MAEIDVEKALEELQWLVNHYQSRGYTQDNHEGDTIRQDISQEASAVAIQEMIQQAHKNLIMRFDGKLAGKCPSGQYPCNGDCIPIGQRCV